MIMDSKKNQDSIGTVVVKNLFDIFIHNLVENSSSPVTYAIEGIRDGFRQHEQSFRSHVLEPLRMTDYSIQNVLLTELQIYITERQKRWQQVIKLFILLPCSLITS